nr:MAG TPA: hypothetical protein [Caudoviricetes sp.]
MDLFLCPLLYIYTFLIEYLLHIYVLFCIFAIIKS